jgi:hypothetical protein
MSKLTVLNIELKGESNAIAEIIGLIYFYEAELQLWMVLFFSVTLKGEKKKCYNYN